MYIVEPRVSHPEVVKQPLLNETLVFHPGDFLNQESKQHEPVLL
jgi:hypothetical protein